MRSYVSASKSHDKQLYLGESEGVITVPRALHSASRSVKQSEGVTFADKLFSRYAGRETDVKMNNVDLIREIKRSR